MIWCTLFTDYSNLICTDRGSMFTTDKWKQLTDLSRVKLHLSGVTAYNSLGSGEHYHEPLQRIFCKAQFCHPTVHS